VPTWKLFHLMYWVYIAVWEFLVAGGMDGITHLIACHYMGITNVG